MALRRTYDCWGITPNSLRMRLTRLKDTKVVSRLMKYYKSDDKEQGEWILVVEAMNVLFPKNIIDD